jgi:hypothetical protein
MDVPFKSSLEDLLDLDIYTIWNFYDVLFDSNIPLADSLQMLNRRQKQPLAQRQQSFQTRIRSSISEEKLGDTAALRIQSTDTIFPRFMAQVQTLFPDLLLLCAEGIRVNAHRAVLAAASPKLMTAITQATNEKTSLPLELSFPDLAPAAVEMCMNFVYTGTLLLGASSLRSVRQAAETLGFSELANQTSLMIDKNPATPSTPEFGSVRGRPRQLQRTGTQFLHSLSKTDPRVKVFEAVCDSAFSLVNQKGKVVTDFTFFPSSVAQFLPSLFLLLSSCSQQYFVCDYLVDPVGVDADLLTSVVRNQTDPRKGREYGELLDTLLVRPPSLCFA